MPTLNFVGQTRENQSSRAAGTARLLNCYREPLGGRSSHLVRPVLGSEAFADTGGEFFRAMLEISDRLFAVAGATLYEISATGEATSLGTLLDGTTQIAGNNGAVTIAARTNYYVYKDGVFSEPATPVFNNIGSVEYIGGYTVLTQRGGRRFAWSNLADPLTFDGLDFATKEGRDDDVVRAKQINGRLFLFGKESTEVWYLTGQSGANAFARQVGGIYERGIKGKDLVANFPNGAFFVGTDGRAWAVGSGDPAPISTPFVEVSLRENNPLHCLYHEDDGHSMLSIVFSDRPAWVYDLATGEWHERAQNATFDPWEARASCFAFGNWVVGYDGGEIRKLMRNGEDAGSPLVRRMVSEYVEFEGKRLRMKELEIYPDTGTTDLPDGREPKVMMRLSNDAGYTWSDYREGGLGLVGQYDKRVMWRALGQHRKVAMELTCSEPGDIAFQSEVRVELVE